ncbi:hypothetical protein NQ318_009465 [Aromia moschata]|uniref:RING-CH-type domain-containing protein n=1 Tax=Aromia moschata TaxID=1265417 RepID=A0AAV8ZA66_9CUCU|nr:hypothetical protein NQ318_009465 [Aromia moschata]
MQNGNQVDKNIFVTLILTESTSSLLNLNVAQLEHLHPENSKICLITPSEFSYFKKQHEKDETKVEQSNSAGTSQENRSVEENLEEVYLKISSDVGLFTTSNCSSSSCMYEFSDDELVKAENSKPNPSRYLEATKIYNRPLITVRSMAHANKLDVHSNEIYVSLLDSDSKSSSEYICRICHGGESLDDLLTPCRCRGTIALVHLKCLERWLKESNHSHCELCQHHYKILREPKYSIGWSILVFLRHPGSHLKDILFDLLAFALYTPSAVASTYMLLMICESLVKSNVVPHGSFSSHIIAFSAVFGMAAIDFTYSSWLMLTFQRHLEAWRDWYRSNSTLKVVLPKIKLRPHKSKKTKDK